MTCLEQFDINDDEIVVDGDKTVLEKLIHDLKKDFSKHPAYGELVRICVENLKMIQEDGMPFSWSQLTAKIPLHPLVERFLHSEEVTFVYNAFNDVDDAKEFVRRFGGVNYRNCYSFTRLGIQSFIAFFESGKFLCRDMVKINDWAKVVSVAYGSSSKPRRFLRAEKT